MVNADRGARTDVIFCDVLEAVGSGEEVSVLRGDRTEACWNCLGGVREPSWRVGPLGICFRAPSF